VARKETARDGSAVCSAGVRTSAGPPRPSLHSPTSTRRLSALCTLSATSALVQQPAAPLGLPAAYALLLLPPGCTDGVLPRPEDAIHREETGLPAPPSTVHPSPHLVQTSGRYFIFYVTRSQIMYVMSFTLYACRYSTRETPFLYLSPPPPAAPVSRGSVRLLTAAVA